MPAKTTRTKSENFTAQERAAMKERAAEMRSAAKRGKEDDEESVLAKIAEMPDSDRVLAETIHKLVKANAPELTSRLWYGQPAYVKAGKTICFFQPSSKFKTRYSTLGFNDPANLDDGTMWPTAFALTAITPADEKRIAALIKKAAG
jgi:uncharacterized protein YdhG (YjbR/CyaY superfamily)